MLLKVFKGGLDGCGVADEHLPLGVFEGNAFPPRFHLVRVLALVVPSEILAPETREWGGEVRVGWCIGGGRGYRDGRVKG